jgi:hypothetical protein
MMDGRGTGIVLYRAHLAQKPQCAVQALGREFVENHPVSCTVARKVRAVKMASVTIRMRYCRGDRQQGGPAQKPGWTSRYRSRSVPDA